YAHSKNVNGGYNNDSDNYDDDNVFSLNLSVPFSAFSHSEAARSVSANYSMNSSKNGDTTHNIGISGTAMQENQLNWQVSEG
ncbi:fimbria/pilus outer membrane usher protein, partial [Enterobacter hormaechei]